MNKTYRMQKVQKTALNKAIREGDVAAFDKLIAEGVLPGRNQFELSVRRAVFDAHDRLHDRLKIAETVFRAVCRDRDLAERASRYVECTLITMGASGHPVRDQLMKMMNIVPGQTAGTHYGVAAALAGQKKYHIACQTAHDGWRRAAGSASSIQPPPRGRQTNAAVLGKQASVTATPA